MALTTIDTNNKLIRFTQQINREFCRENCFSPYMGEDVTSIIRIRQELKAGRESLTVARVTRLRNAPTGSGTLMGNEEKIDNYGQRVKVDWARNAVVTNAAEQQRDSADIFGEAKPLLSDWGKELQRDEIIAALMALPDLTTTPGADTRVNGKPYQAVTGGASAAERSTWQSANRDRILFGAATGNMTITGATGAAGDHATSLATLDGTADLCTARNLTLLKRIAMNADPKIRPFKTRNGYEYYVAFMGTNPFRDLKNDLNSLGGTAVNLHARPRETSGPNGAPDNPLFQDGDQLYDGVIARQVPEISSFVTSVWTSLTTAGAAGTPVGYLGRVEPVFLCGQQAATLCWGQMAKPTFRKEDDYGFITGTGIQMCYGVAKIAKVHSRPSGIHPNAQVQFGMATGFFASSAD